MNSAGTNDNLPIAFDCFDLPTTHKATISDNLACPVKQVNAAVKTYGNGSPALNASKFAAIATIAIGCHTVFKTKFVP